MSVPFQCADLMTTGSGEKRIRVPVLTNRHTLHYQNELGEATARMMRGEATGVLDTNATPLMEFKMDGHADKWSNPRWRDWVDYKARMGI
jgi:hypothetical protein